MNRLGHRSIALASIIAGAAFASAQWRYSSPGAFDDVGVDIATDLLSNYYVVGSYAIGSSDPKIVILKYGFAHDIKWVRFYNGPFGMQDVPTRIVHDKNGSIYVCGSSEGTMSGNDYVVLKYDEAGNRLWARRHTGPGMGDDQAMDLAVDASGNVRLPVS
jgi:hypothetical protein